jgi:hypothetical protein
MVSLKDFLSTLTASDARATLYYLSRYLKQADQFEKYGKDFFVDEELSAPSDAVKAQTYLIIEVIERFEGLPASKFDDPTYEKWAAHVGQLESELQPEPTELQRERAMEFVDAISYPKPKP